jgi:hypothetical protein
LFRGNLYICGSFGRFGGLHACGFCNFRLFGLRHGGCLCTFGFSNLCFLGFLGKLGSNAGLFGCPGLFGCLCLLDGFGAFNGKARLFFLSGLSFAGGFNSRGFRRELVALGFCKISVESRGIFIDKGIPNRLCGDLQRELG